MHDSVTNHIPKDRADRPGRLPTWAVVVSIGAVATAMGGLSYFAGPDVEEATAASEAFSSTPAPASSGERGQTVSLAQVRRFIQDRSAIIVDARSPQRFDAGHLPGAINLPATNPEHRLPDKVRRRAQLMPVIVYCESAECPYAERVAQRLRRAGLHPVRVFKGGWREWQQRDPIASSGS